MNMILLYTTFPNLDIAKSVSHALVSEKIVGCANILGSVDSCYLWDGKVCQEAEVAVLFKTLPEKVALCQEKLMELHPYDAPAVLQISATSLCDNYSHWLKRGLT